jgi:hypothetical protein
MLDVELSGSIGNLLETCAKNRQEWTIYDFWANMSYVLKDWVESGITNRSRILLFTLDELKESAAMCLKFQLYEAAYRITETIESLAEHHQKIGVPDKTVHGKYHVPIDFKHELLSIIRFIRENCLTTESSNLIGKFGDRTLIEILNDTSSILGESINDKKTTKTK